MEIIILKWLIGDEDETHVGDNFHNTYMKTNNISYQNTYQDIPISHQYQQKY